MKQTLRTHTTQTRYDLSRQEARQRGYRRCYLCEARVIKEFRSWKIVENEYPYDRIASTHHMVTLKRHTPETDLNDYERMEFERDVRPYLHLHYDMIFENTVRTKSIPGHHHLHMITLKEQHTQTQHTPLSIPQSAYVT